MTDRRPVQNAKDKFEWLLQVARDAMAEYGLPLAVELAIEHFDNNTGQCNPGDDTLAKSLGTSTKTIQRRRKVLIERGHLRHDPSKTGRPRDGNVVHTLLLNPSSTGGHTGVHRSTPTGGQISPDRWTENARPVDSQKSQVIDPPQKSVPNPYELVLNQGRDHHHEKTAHRKAPASLVDILNERANAVGKKYGY